LELACCIDPKTPNRFLGDPTRLRQILINLVGNAIKFTEHGEVVVSVGTESRSLNEVVLHFSVSDTGIGIPSDKHAAVFEPFTQADSSTTRRYGGTGLGLSISSELVKLMGGKLWLESELGKGSTFHFTVPCGPGGGSAEVTPAGLNGLAEVPVLVVDDNATNRRVLTEMLEGWRMKPVAAATGQSALAALKRATDKNSPFPVLIIDAHMPKMDGFQLASRVRQSARTTATKLIMLTSAGGNDQQRSRKLRVNACLNKPIRQSQLLQTLLSLLNGAAQKTSTSEKNSPSAARPLRILVAEDNPVNIELMEQLLRRKGHWVEVVENGREALNAMERKQFDLVLMDVQMPVMGGLEAAASIRSLERSSGGHVPIIGTTAHAAASDRERVLQSGMDAYLAKPIQAQDLYAWIEQLTASSSDVDEAALLDGVGGEAALLVNLVDVFLDVYPRLLTRIRRAITMRRVESFRQATHALKGSISNFGRTRAYDAACRLDARGKTGSLRGAEKAFTRLKEELIPFRQSLKDLKSRTSQRSNRK
jgi:CheY-like chemotaxis protein